MPGRQIEVPHAPGTRYYDLWNGAELKPEVQGSTATLSFEMEAHGYGAVLATTSEPDEPLHKLLARMSELSQKRLQDFSHEWKFLPQQIVAIAADQTRCHSARGHGANPGRKV